MKIRDEYFDNIKIKSYKPKEKRVERTGTFKDVDFKKSLGQNFISDKNLLNSIIKLSEITNQDNVLEIGAGAGTLTEVLSKNSKKVLSYEIDRDLKTRLDNLKSENDNLEIIFQDFMTVDEKEIFKGEKFKVVANIPYYITTPIIFKLLNEKDRISSMMFMVQKEVAVRFASKENCKEYGIPSVILQSIADVSVVKTVPKECFTPMPKVDSALMKIELKNKFDIADFDFFSRLVHASFSMRRKTLLNNLKTNFNLDKELIINYLKKLKLNENIRPEEISVENYVKIANLLINK